MIRQFFDLDLMILDKEIIYTFITRNETEFYFYYTFYIRILNKELLSKIIWKKK